jgi:hypothetical protein
MIIPFILFVVLITCIEANNVNSKVKVSDSNPCNTIKSNENYNK